MSNAPTDPVLEVLLPRGARPIPPDGAEPALTALYRVAAPRWVRANVVATLDGAAAGADGRSGSINTPADNRVFRVLRALADVVLVGAGTARTEGYRTPDLPASLVEARRRLGRPDVPALAVVSRSGDLPDALLDDGPWVFAPEDAPHAGRLRDRLPAERVHLHPGRVDLAGAIGTLAGAGLNHVLAEGGPQLLGALLAHGLVDELCVTWSPLVVGGDASRVVAGPPLPPGTAARPAHLLHADGTLLGRWLLDGGAGASDLGS